MAIVKEKLFCKLFKHDWLYSLSSITNQNFRVCKRCNTLQIYHKDLFAFGSVWVNTVQRTKKGKEEWIKNENIKI
jgi:hypothetical protein